MTTRTTEVDRTVVSGHALENIGAAVIRYGLAAVLLWVGLLKFTVFEAEGIQGLVANSPFMSWAYGGMSVRGFSAVIAASRFCSAFSSLFARLLRSSQPLAALVRSSCSSRRSAFS